VIWINSVRGAILIRELRDRDVDAFVKLRREALLDSPLAFVASPSDDRFSSAGELREQLRVAPEFVIMVRFDDNSSAQWSLSRSTSQVFAQGAPWGVYVTPNHRRRGIASDLSTQYRGMQLTCRGVLGHLKVSLATPGALRLYEKAGFHVWGAEPAGARYDERTVAEHHVALCLEPDPD
jgi:GNAT superfamily N-acetyltransferase